MMNRPAIRRSPLAHRHKGAKWVSATLEWPLDLGDPGREQKAAREAVALVDRGPLDKFVLRGASATTGTVTTGALFGLPRAELWATHDDEAMLLAPAGAPRAQGVDATDVSSAYATLRILGPRGRALLEEVTQIDVSDAGLPDNRVVFGPLAGVMVTLARHDGPGMLGFTILVERDLAEYVWDALLHIGSHHGLVVAGNAVEGA